MITAIYNLIKEIYEKRIELAIMLITTAIALGIGLYVLSMASQVFPSPGNAWSNVSNIQSVI